MGRNARVALGVILVVIAVGGWWLHGRTAAPSGPAAASAEPSPTAVARRDRPARGEAADLPRVMVDDDPKGALRLEGQVVDGDDHGAAGATVVLGSNPPRTATTEADGSFAFDGLVARPYTLVARAAAGVAGPVTARLTAKSDPVVLRLVPAARLTVAVVDSDGKPIDGATVELRGIDVQRQVTRGPSAVFSPVAPGGYQIAAWADGRAHAFQRIVIAKGDASARLVLTAGAPVAGRVVDDRGAGVGNARVRYGGASDWTQQASDRHDAVVTAADGSFRFDALPAGSFRLFASHPERAPGSSALITLDGRTAHDGVVIALEAGAVVRGKVVDAEHRPVAAARVRIAPAGAGPGGPRTRMFEPPRQAYSDAAGAFEIRGLPRKPLAALALHDAGSSQTVAIDASRGEVSNVTLVIDVTGTIAGIVVDPDGHPVEGAQVTAGPGFGGRGGFDPGEWQLRGLPQDVSDAAGRFALTGLGAGQYRLSATPSTRAGRGRGGFRDGVTATTGDKDVRLVVQPDGSVKGKVAFADGSAPDVFTVSIQQNQQSFLAGGGAFTLDGIAPGTYQLAVRGPSFQNQSIEVTIAGQTTTDAGTITVVKGRSIAGVVLADGQPVAGATVYAGRIVFGNGTTSGAPTGPALAQFGDPPKSATTDAAGAFSLSGFGGGDLTLIAEHDAVGRSRALRLPAVMPGQTELTLVLEKFGSLAGFLRQGGKPADGVVVTCQSTSTPGALYSVAAGSDGAYRFDRLAPDTYKVSATTGTPRFGMRFYSRQIDVPAGQAVTLDLTLDPGSVAVDVQIAAKSGAVGAASVWLASGAIAATSASELTLKLAAAGAGTSSRVTVLSGEPAHFTEVAPGAYTACVTALPLEVRGLAIRSYVERHGDTLATVCQAVAVAAAPDAQRTSVTVDVPAMIPDAPGGGSGSGSGTGPGTGSGTGSGARPGG